MEKSPVVAVAKEVDAREIKNNEIVLSDGRIGRVHSVASSLIEEVNSRLVDPLPPMFMNNEKGREEPNDVDPGYLKQLEDMKRKRGKASLDAIIMFGLELVDGVPEDGLWLKKLQTMERRGHLDLTGYDLNDPFDLEFLYKSYIVCDNHVIEKISEVSGITEKDVEKAERSFRGKEK